MLIQLYRITSLILAFPMLIACGSDSSYAPDIDMKGIWGLSLDYGNGLGRSFAIEITSQKSGKFNGYGGAYLIDGMVEGNDVSMSIYTGASVNCGYFTQTYTEEYEFDYGTVQNGEIRTTADWITSCRFLSAEIRVYRL